MTESTIKQRVQRIIVSVSVLILIGKFAAYYLTNSVGILTDAMESIVNVVAGFISLYSLYIAAKPRDKEHPYGHGKIEFISASIEGLMISVAGVVIIYEGVRRLLTPTVVERLDTGIIVIAVAGLINYLMGWYSIYQGRKYNSMALIAGGKHLQSDTYSTIGLVVGLLLLYYTKIAWIDSALALVFGSIIVYTGISILRKTIGSLLDEADEKLLTRMVKAASDNRQEDWIDIHNTKTIQAGSDLFIYCDLTLPWYYNIKQSHNTCDALIDTLNEAFKGSAQILVHSDPCSHSHCPNCLMKRCDHRMADFIAPLPFTREVITYSDDERNQRLGAGSTIN